MGAYVRTYVRACVRACVRVRALGHFVGGGRERERAGGVTWLHQIAHNKIGGLNREEQEQEEAEEEQECCRMVVTRNTK